ncbi:3-isopropylmalate dehydratase large subunit [bacterium]|nr:3-isopropylmalate dehydratase large subunit [bacterium]
MNFIETVLARRSGKAELLPGETVWIDVDTLLTHDVCGPGTIAIFQKEFGRDARVWDRDRLVLMPDHYIFTEDAHAIRNRDIVRQFAIEQDLPHYYDDASDRYRGVCHVGFAEEGFARPGRVLFGTDSHTCTAGAFGQFATGIGNTDAAFIMGTGRLWIKVPETIRIILHGEWPDHLMAKDVILQIIGDLGVDGATYCTLEFTGGAVAALNMDERMTLCNMAIEAGGKCGVIAPDEVTNEYLRQRGITELEEIYINGDANYKKVLVYDVSLMHATVAKPFSPDLIANACDLDSIALDQCYIGSCTGGKVADFIAAARILNRRQVKTRTVAVPATREVEAALKTETVDGISLCAIFKEAGVEIGQPSCAACLGGPEDTFGRLNGAEVCLSTTNRNFPGRMGSPRSQTYLASPLTVAASAITGRITDPVMFLR